MIQDFSNTFDGKQAVMLRPMRIGGRPSLKKATGAVLVSTMIVGLVSSVAFTVLIRSGLSSLTVRKNTKIELLKVQQGLSQQRKVLLSMDHVVKTAGRLGLYVPSEEQVVRRF